MKKSSVGNDDFPENFKTWNPMKDDYVNSRFNKYCSGPGADLDPELQPSELAKHALKGKNGGSAGPVPYLFFKNLPKGMTKNAIFNLCKSYGNVTQVRDSIKNPYFFVDFASIADMEAVFRALEHNTYGFIVLVGRHLKESTKDAEPHGTGRSFHPAAINENTIDLENRKYSASSKQHPRPHVQQKPIVSCNDYNSSTNLLQQNDPQRHFLIEDDAHGLERAGLVDFNVTLGENANYKYHTGRAYIEMPANTRKFIAEKSDQSIGHFEAATERYTNDPKSANKQSNCYPCSQCTRICDSICARCSQYFCSIECQRKAWPQHRIDCGKPEHLKKNHSKITDEEDSGAVDANTFPANKAKTVMAPTNINTTSTTSSFKSSLTTKIPQSGSSVSVTDSGAVVATAVPENKAKTVVARTDISTISTTSSVKSSLTTKIPNSGSSVSITAVIKSNVVFIRSKTPEDNLLFFNINSAIQSDSKNLKPLRTVPKCGHIVVTQFNNVYSRAMILNTDDLNKIKLVHIDYGNVDIKLFDELLVAPEYYSELPRLAIPVILKDVPDVCMTDDIRKFMYSYLDGIDLQLKYDENDDFIKERGVYRVVLLDESTNQNFNNVIISLSKPVEPSSCNDVVLRNYLKHQMLPEGENVELIVMDNSLLNTACISCTTPEYALEIQKFQIELQNYANSLPQQNYAPRVDELCIAKYSVDQKWYRGRCLDLVGDGYPTIVFFDYGNISLVNIKDIRRYPLKFVFPVYTSDCEIEGLPEHCDDNIVAKLEQLIPNGGMLKCDSIRAYEEDQFHTIKVNRIIEQLDAEGLLSASPVTA